jgi:hypothetical protein
MPIEQSIVSPRQRVAIVFGVISMPLARFSAAMFPRKHFPERMNSGSHVPSRLVKLNSPPADRSSR